MKIGITFYLFEGYGQEIGMIESPSKFVQFTWAFVEFGGNDTFISKKRLKVLEFAHFLKIICLKYKHFV